MDNFAIWGSTLMCWWSMKQFHFTTDFLTNNITSFANSILKNIENVSEWLFLFYVTFPFSLNAHILTLLDESAFSLQIPRLATK